jgi:hypothetical protein
MLQANVALLVDSVNPELNESNKTLIFRIICNGRVCFAQGSNDKIIPILMKKVR